MANTKKAATKKSETLLESDTIQLKVEPSGDIIREIIDKDIKTLKQKKSKNSKVDVKHIGVPNICFSLSDIKSKNEKRYKTQRLLRGFDDSETWTLYYNIAHFIVPRLERYNEITNVFLRRPLEAKKDVQYLLTAMKLIIRDQGADGFTKAEKLKLKKGLEVFPKIFMTLWW